MSKFICYNCKKKYTREYYYNKHINEICNEKKINVIDLKLKELD